MKRRYAQITPNNMLQLCPAILKSLFIFSFMDVSLWTSAAFAPLRLDFLNRCFVWLRLKSTPWAQWLKLLFYRMNYKYVKNLMLNTTILTNITSFISTAMERFSWLCAPWRPLRLNYLSFRLKTQSYLICYIKSVEYRLTLKVQWLIYIHF